MTNETRAPLETWGGVECTVNRVRGNYHDQLRRSGHLTRPEDIERFAALGISALRVPLVWERSCRHDESPDFAWAEPMLARVRQCGLHAIATLVHHGSGPPFTHLLDPAFDTKLARYARRVAEGFPWIRDFTPVNEPLTTARFSALYGHWYPHVADTASFLRALLHECRATALAMRAIREITPHARLIQTEDIATVRSTPELAEQAAYENERRFLSFDLLCGRVDGTHPLYGHLLEHGITERDLAFFLEQPCPPDILGVNYYFTSDRYLDQNLSAYPAWSHGGNGRQSYADIDAGHVPGVGLVGHAQVLRTVWQRYRMPLAITEVHAGCTREEQMRWLHEAYGAAHEVRAEGISVQAVTAWALLGSYDWNTLVTREAGVYESGIFDLRSEPPRPTALARMLEGLAKEGRFEHPVLAQPGWWHRVPGLRTAKKQGIRSRPLLITGGNGSLARAFARACETRGLAYLTLPREQLDITQPHDVAKALNDLAPWAVVNAAGYVHLDDAQRDREYCERVNAHGPALLAELCKKNGIRLLTFSSDYVFDGMRREPYVETDPVAPASVYGTSQVEAERRVLSIWKDVLIVRTSCLFGLWDERDRVAQVLHKMAAGERVRLCPQSTFSPTYAPHLVEASLDLLIDGANALWHLTSGGQETWVSLMTRLARGASLGCDLIEQYVQTSNGSVPRYSVLGSARGVYMPPIEAALERYLRERPAAMKA